MKTNRHAFIASRLVGHSREIYIKYIDYWMP